MKALLTFILLTISAGAVACPAGEHIHGGYNSHHKGGYCSPDPYIEPEDYPYTNEALIPKPTAPVTGKDLKDDDIQSKPVGDWAYLPTWDDAKKWTNEAFKGYGISDENLDALAGSLQATWIYHQEQSEPKGRYIIWSSSRNALAQYDAAKEYTHQQVIKMERGIYQSEMLKTGKKNKNGEDQG